MPTRALYAGSFDPITRGHLDVLRRAAKMFDEVIVAIGVNVKKPGLFTPEERKALIEKSCATIKNVRVVTFSGLTAPFARKQKCGVLVRGLRDAQDFGFEMQMAHMNRHLESAIETVFIPTVQEFSEISSSLVKEVASLGGDVRELLPPVVAAALQAKLRADIKPVKKSKKRAKR